jgi:hypothetical protein
LYLKAKKCKFRIPKIKYLELVIEEGKLAMDPAKLKGILDWPASKTVKEVRSFIGFGNFYHHFVKGFSHLTHPLHDLLKKDKKLSEECQDSFNQLKKQFTEEPVLIMPDHSKPLQIQVDSLLFATEGILTQTDTNRETDNKDIIVLLEHLFVNLIDMELQKKIANSKNMDYAQK